MLRARSHQLDGERAGFINKEFDQLCMEKIVTDPDALALTGEVSEVHRNYHIPISNTAAATMVLENKSIVQRKAA